MSTTPHKHAEIIKAWADGKQVQVKYRDTDWVDCSAEGFYFCIGGEYRIKPETAAPVYPETNMTDQDICNAVPSLDGRIWNPQCVAAPIFAGFRKMGNAAIRRAIDDGQVVLPGMGGNAGFTPSTSYDVDDIVKIGDETLKVVVGGRRAGKTMQVNEFLQKRLDHAERVLKANGFTYSPDEGWSISSDNLSAEMKYGLVKVSEMVAQHEKEMEAALGKQRRAEQHLTAYANLADRVAHAVAKHFGATTQQQFKQADAIVLLEKAK